MAGGLADDHLTNRQRVVFQLRGARAPAQLGSGTDALVKRLQGPGARWRLRVGTWRVVYFMDPSEQLIIVTSVRPRGSAYKP